MKNAILVRPAVEADMQEHAVSSTGPLVQPYIVEVRDLRKRYGSTVALDGVSLQVPRGQTVALLGPNGAGKTTLIECLIGLIAADSGELRVLGTDVRRFPRKNLERLGIQLQDARLMPYARVAEVLELFASFYERHADIARLVSTLRLEGQLRKRISELSGGWRQRVRLALAVINDPDLLVLDEPSVGLDPIARRELWTQIQMLKSADKSVLLTTHYMDEAETLADWIVMISRGRITAVGTVRELIAGAQPDAANLDEAYAFYVRASGEV